MKLKTLVKLNELKQDPEKIFIHLSNGEERELTAVDFWHYRNWQILWWQYVIYTKKSDGEDGIIVHI